jgi:hypothetical protein
MGSPTRPNSEWNCLIKSASSEAIHAASVDVDGAIRDVACHPPVSSHWELAQPEQGVSYAACGRCISTGAFGEIPGITKDTISSIEFDPDRYEPPVTSLTKVVQ